MDLEVASHIPVYCKFDICFCMEHQKDIWGKKDIKAHRV